MKILNLYAGVGGNAKLWDREKHSITSVEYSEEIAALYRKLYPNDDIINKDAVQIMLDTAHEFDFVWSSPPCQSHTKMVKATRHKSQQKRLVDPALFQQIIWLQHFYNGFWIVENVSPYYVIMCPTGVHVKQIGRHVFWSNFDIGDIKDVKRPPGFINKANLQGKKELQQWLGIHFEENIYYENNHCPVQILRNAVHPLIGKQILDKVEDLCTK